MTRYVVSRLAGGIAVIAGVIVLSFFVTHYIGDPVFLLVDRELSTPEERQAMVEAGGFDRPAIDQFTDFAGGAVQGDFGTSIWQNRPASEVVIERIPATLLLAGASAVFTFAIAIPAALTAARNAGRWPETVITTVSTALASFTPFWLALSLILLFSVEVDVLPTSGYGVFPELILPVLALSAPAIGHITQIMQSSLTSEFVQPYVRTARSKGLPERLVGMRHVLPNAALVGVTLLGTLAANLMNGTVLIESIFAWPGLGQVSLQAIERRDLPVLMAAVFYLALVVTTINIVIDLLYMRLDPRVRLR